MDNTKAVEDLITYASNFNLRVVTGPEEIAQAMGFDDVDEIPPGMTHAAGFPDHAYINFGAFVQDGKLRRFGWEQTKDEDPGDIFDTTLTELNEAGDPRNYL